MQQTIRLCLIIAAVLLANLGLRAQEFETNVIGMDITSAWGVTSGDYDDDGDIDCAVTGKNPGTVQWLETIPGEESTDHFLYQVIGGARYLTSVDIDSDNDLDVLVSGYGENRFILFENVGGEGDELFQISDFRTQEGGAWRIVPADWNSDGSPDLALCSYISGVVTLLLNNDGVFSDAFVVEIEQPMGLFPVDFDMDGDQDLLVGSASQDEGGVYWIEQTAPLQFESFSLITDDNLRATSVAAADLDNDGDIDIIAPDFVNDGITWWEARPGEWVSEMLPGVLTLPREVVVTDFDEDGWIDVACTEQGYGGVTGSVRWWRNLHNGVFDESMIDEEAQTPFDLALSDFDRDSDLDLLTAHYASGEIIFYRNLVGSPAVIEGSITGLADGVPVSGARVTLVEENVVGFSDSLGHYRLGAPVGTYSVRAEHPCWNTDEIAGIEAIDGETSVADLQLRRPISDVGVSSLNLLAHNSIELITSLPITNSGDGELEVLAEVSGNLPNDAWIGLSPAALTVAPGTTESFSITISPDTSNSSSWDYYGEIALFTNACPDSEIVLPVFVYVLDAPSRPDGVPTTTQLLAAYPNPFNSTTTIRFDLAEPGSVSVDLFNLHGQRVSNLLESNLAAGSHHFELRADALSSGVYFVHLNTDRVRQSQKLLLLK